MHKIIGKNFELLYYYIEFIQHFHRSLCNVLKEIYQLQMKERFLLNNQSSYFFETMK